MVAGTDGKGDEGDEGGMGELAQEASSAAMAIMGSSRIDRAKTVFATQGNVMSLLLLEALGALLLFVFIVWWTMFSGRKNGELQRGSESSASSQESDPSAEKK